MNLKKTQDTQFQTGLEQVETARKGGIASGKARREKKKMREAVELIMSMPIKRGKEVSVEDIQNLEAANGKNISVQEAIIIAQVNKALMGDTKAAEYLRDTVGEHPSLKVEADVILPVFTGEDDLED